MLFTLARGFILQVTDLHASETRPGAAERFAKFCKSSFERDFADSKEMDLLIITGDLVDGTPGIISAASRGQFKGEWDLVTEAFKPCLEVAERFKIPIIAIRGNHDGFGVGPFNSESNVNFLNFRKLIENRKPSKYVEYEGNQIFDIKGTTVVALDSADTSGQCRQFFGHFNLNVSKWVTQHIPDDDSDILFFSHYPIGGYIKTDRLRLLKVIESYGKRVVGYHAGHFHRGFGYPMLTERGTYTEHQAPHFLGHSDVRVIGGERWQAVVDARPLGDDADRMWHSFGSRFDDGRAFVYAPDTDTFPVGFTGNGGSRRIALGRTTEKTLTASYPPPVKGVWEVEFIDFKPAFLNRWMFTHVQEALLVMSFVFQCSALLFALWLYFRCPKTDLFPVINLISCVIMPIAPLAIFQAIPGRYSLVFWWGALTLDDFTLMPNDISTMGVVFVQGKVLVASACLLLLTRFNNIAIRVTVGIQVLVMQLVVQRQMLHRGGLTGMFGFPFLWDLTFWALSGVIFSFKSFASDKLE